MMMMMMMMMMMEKSFQKGKGREGEVYKDGITYRSYPREKFLHPIHPGPALDD